MQRVPPVGRPAPSRTASGGSRLPAVAVLTAVALLAVLLTLVTWGNLDREEELMERFLQEEGLTVIRSFEAGVRAAMLSTASESSALETLVREIARADRVAYVRVADEFERLLAESGPEAGRIEPRPAQEVLAAGAAATRMVTGPGGGGVFEVARELRPVDAPRGDDRPREAMMRRWQQWCSMGAMRRPRMGMGRRSAGDAPGEACRQIIAVGLYTEEFDAARRQDVRNSLLLGATLLLAGGAGFYLLLLTQRNRVARSTIEGLRLYTRDVIESLPDALVTLDPEGRVVSVNSRARELLGLGEREPTGVGLHDLVGAEQCAIEPLLRAGKELRDHPMECTRPGCDPLPVKISAAHLRDADGTRVGTVLLIRDVRELRAVEEQLERSRRLASLGRMAAGIAHEIRNPLGTLRGFAQYFGGKNADDPAASQYAALMVSEIDRLNRIIAALLQFARPREPELQEVSLASLAAKIEKLVADEARAAGLSYRSQLPEGDAVLRADPDLLTQALLNLLHNAFAATEKGGEVVLGARPEPDSVRVFVDDTGRGLTLEEKERMFDPFYTTRKTGTGLGLAVVHQVVEQHGGRIEVESILGRGTRVTLILPRPPEAAP